MKILLGFILAIAIGAGARIAGIPVPAPPAIIGALLVVSMTIGYILTDKLMTHRTNTMEDLCGGPTGNTKGGSA